jgi:hypothetical protein
MATFCYDCTKMLFPGKEDRNDIRHNNPGPIYDTCDECGDGFFDGQGKKVPNSDELLEEDIRRRTAEMRALTPQDWAKRLFTCEVCQKEHSNGRQFFQHVKENMLPETSARIEKETGTDIEDFLGFCIQEGLTIAHYSPDDPYVTQAIEFFKLMGEDPLADLPPLAGEEPDPDIWDI